MVETPLEPKAQAKVYKYRMMRTRMLKRLLARNEANNEIIRLVLKEREEKENDG